MKKILTVLFTFVMLLGVASAEICTTIDFNDLKTGEIVKNQYPGVAIKSTVNEAIIFDSYNPTGGDGDLATNTQENILIIAENLVDANNDDLIDIPDDNANGGTIVFTFDTPVEIKSVTAIDIESVESLRLRSRSSTPSTIATTFASGLGDGSLEVIALTGHVGVKKFKAKFSGSGSIDDLEYCSPEEEVPEFGFFAGLAVLGLAGAFIYKRRN